LAEAQQNDNKDPDDDENVGNVKYYKPEKVFVWFLIYTASKFHRQLKATNIQACEHFCCTVK